MQLDGVMLFVAELEPMAAFYRQALGFRCNEATRSEDWIEFETGGPAFALHRIPPHHGVRPSPAPRETATVKPVVAVADLDAARERLAAAGATILDRPWRGWDFADPEGNVIGVRKR